MDLYEELVGLVAALDRASIEYALCGGLAVAFHGYPRFTKDIDLLVREDDVERIREAVRSLGFGLPALPMQFDLRKEAECTVHRISKIEGEQVLTLDLLVPGPGLRAAWQGRVRFPWKDTSICVVSREGLVHMKRLANRAQDRLDLQKLGVDDE